MKGLIALAAATLLVLQLTVQAYASDLMIAQ